MIPTADDIKVFLVEFDKLCKFEACLSFSHQHLGIYNEEERKNFPIPGVVKVHDWLKRMAEDDVQP